MSFKQRNYGEVVIGVETANPQTLLITEMVAAEIGGRTVNVLELEDGTYTIGVNNPEYSVRLPESYMRLSKDSFHALMGVMTMFCLDMGIDPKKSLTIANGGSNTIEYYSSVRERKSENESSQDSQTQQ